MVRLCTHGGEFHSVAAVAFAGSVQQVNRDNKGRDRGHVHRQTILNLNIKIYFIY
jgi:hypothetical protein